MRDRPLTLSELELIKIKAGRVVEIDWQHAEDTAWVWRMGLIIGFGVESR